MATNNSNNLKVLKRGIKDSTPMEVDHLELRVRNRHGHEIFLRVTPSDVTRDLNLPSSSNWDWHPAQVRILHKIQQKVFTPGPSSSASTKPSSSTDNSNVSEPPKLAHPVVEDDNISDLTSDSDTQPQDVHLISLEINLKLRYSSLKDIIESCCWSRETKGLVSKPNTKRQRRSYSYITDCICRYMIWQKIFTAPDILTRLIHV